MDCRPTPRRGWRWRTRALFAWPILLGPAANAGDLIFKDGFDPTSPPGETCLAPVILLPDAEVAGTTIGRANDFEVAQPDVSPCAAALGTAYPAPDVAYELIVMASGVYTITVTPTARWDVALIVLADCAAGSSSCLVASDGDGEGETESVTLALNAGTPVSLIVDGWHADESGPFTIIALPQ